MAPDQAQAALAQAEAARLEREALELRERKARWDRAHFGPLDTYEELAEAAVDANPFNDLLADMER